MRAFFCRPGATRQPRPHYEYGLYGPQSERRIQGGEECRGEEEKLKEPAELWLMNILAVALQNNLPQSQTIDGAFQMN